MHTHTHTYIHSYIHTYTYTYTHTHTRTSIAGFSSPSRLALNGLIAAAVNKTVREHRPLPEGAGVGVWGGEIGPHNGGSPVCDHTSMRWAVFGDSMWYVWGWVRGGENVVP